MPKKIRSKRSTSRLNSMRIRSKPISIHLKYCNIRSKGFYIRSPTRSVRSKNCNRHLNGFDIRSKGEIAVNISASIKVQVTDSIGNHSQETRKAASGVTHVRKQQSNQEAFITPTCTLQKRSNMIYPLINLMATHTHWKHKYTALLYSGSANDLSFFL